MSSGTVTMTATAGGTAVAQQHRGYPFRRYYDPQTGQFINVDPAVDQTAAPYAYVGGDPVNLLDPSGLGIESWFLGTTTEIGNYIANSPVAEPFLSATTDIGNALGGAYYDFASAHPCIAFGISAGVQIAGLFVAPEEVGLEELAAEDAERGGLNLYKWNDITSTRATGWRTGDRMLTVPWEGSAKATWMENASRLRQEMRSGAPIFETYVDQAGNLIPTKGFLNAERNLLLNRGWQYNPTMRAWTPGP